LANTNNSKIHQNQSVIKQTAKQTTHEVSTAATTEDEDEDEMNTDKLKSIRKLAQKGQKQLENNQQRNGENKEVEKSAIVIQKLWRGYSTRKRTLQNMAESLHQKRTQDYIIKLTKDMEMTKQALENERKIQQLQMQAIQQLWKKVSNMQTNPESSAVDGASVAGGLGGQDIVQDLTKTCCMLTNQVRTLIGLPGSSVVTLNHL
jgi:centrosomal protein CEP97